MIRLKWWQWLTVFILAYVILAGFLIPLKPGIYSYTPQRVKGGQVIIIDIHTYNTRLLSSTDHSAYLKYEDYHLSADGIDIHSANHLAARFNIPGVLPEDSKSIRASIIINNPVDGYFLYPDALFIEGSELSPTIPGPRWEKGDMPALSKNNAFRFPYRHILYETIRNTFFHVAIWMAMFLILIVSLFYSFKYLTAGDLVYDQLSSSYTGVAIVYGTIGLATGSLWAKYTWGTFWTSDIKLNMTAVAMLIYIAYWVLRASIKAVDSRARISAVYNIFAFAALIPLVFVVPRLTDSLHPGNGGNPALGGEDLDNTLRAVFYPAIAGLALLGHWMAHLTFRMKRIREKIESAN